jgi:xyloglucan-specific exo-beta-1,4-glucanase
MFGNSFLKKVLISIFVVSSMLAGFWQSPVKAIANPLPWKNTNIQGMGFVTGLIYHPTAQNLLYARTDVGGIFKYSNNTWTPLTDFANSTEKDAYNVESIGLSKSDPTKAYFVSGNGADGTLYLSNNQGTSFSKKPITQNSLPIVVSGNSEGYRGGGERLLVDPTNNSNLWYGSRENGLLKSTDEGTSWTKITTLPNGQTGNGIAFLDIEKTSTSTKMYAGVSGDGIYTSTDSGSSWNKIFTLPGSQYPYRSKATNGKFYFSLNQTQGTQPFAPGGLYRYDGSTTTEISPFSGKSVTGFDIDTSGKIVVDTFDTTYFQLGDQTMFQSTDDGVNWQRLNRTFSVPNWYTTQTPGNNPYDPTWYTSVSDFFLSSVNFNPNNNSEIWFGNGWGVFQTLDGNSINQNWSANMKGFEELVVNNVGVTPTGKILTSVWDVGGFIQNDADTLPSFHISNDAYIANMTSTDWSSDGQKIVMAGSDQNWGNPSGRLVASTDGGATWGNLNRPIDAFGGNIVMDANDSNTLVWSARDASGMRYGEPWTGKSWITNDFGQNWRQINDLPGWVNLQVFATQSVSLAADKQQAGDFYTFGCNKGDWQPSIYRSTDKGQTFTKIVQTNVPCAGEINLKINPAVAGQLWISTINSAKTEQKLRYSSDKGNTFKAMAGIDEVRQFGFGKPAPGKTNPTLFVIGVVNGVEGLYQSDDATTLVANPTFVNISQGNGFGQSMSITGSPLNYGEVFVGTSGRGVMHLTAQAQVPPCTNGATNPPNCDICISPQTLQTSTNPLSVNGKMCQNPIVINTPPTVTITSPTNNSSAVMPSSINVFTTALDTDGTVTTVEIFDNGVTIGNAMNQILNDWAYILTNPSVGTHSLTAKATDNSGNITISAPVITLVNPQPPLLLIKSTDITRSTCTPSTVTVGASITCTASFTPGKTGTISFSTSPNTGSCTTTTITSTSTTASCSFVTSGIGNGITVSAKGSGDTISDPSTNSGTINVTSIPSVFTAIINSPTNNSIIDAPTTAPVPVLIHAGVQPFSLSNPLNNPVITKIEFFEGSTKLGEDTVDFDGDWNLLTNFSLGNHSITVKATKANGDTAISPITRFTVAIPTPPATSVVINSSNVVSSYCSPLTAQIGAVITCTSTFTAGKTGTLTFNSFDGLMCTTPVIATIDTSASCAITVPSNTAIGVKNISFKGTGDQASYPGRSAGQISITQSSLPPDTTPPTLTIHDPYICGGNIFGDVSDTSGVANVKITLTLLNSSIVSTKMFTLTPDINGHYTLPLQSTNPSGSYYVAEGNYSVSYQATDTIGNTTGASTYTADIKTPEHCNPAILPANSPTKPTGAVLIRTGGGANSIQVLSVVFALIGVLSMFGALCVSQYSDKK